MCHGVLGTRRRRNVQMKENCWGSPCGKISLKQNTNNIIILKSELTRTSCQARLAQSVEHETLNLRVVGSSPTLGAFFFLFFYLVGSVRSASSSNLYAVCIRLDPFTLLTPGYTVSTMSSRNLLMKSYGCKSSSPILKLAQGPLSSSS
jgi:hypothetical protein